MKQLVFFVCVVFLLGLSGCASSRATLRDAAEKERKETVTETAKQQQAASRDSLTALLQGSERRTVVIKFEEVEYYQAATDTAEGENHAAAYNRRTGEQSDKPPNSGSVKARRKGTITINAAKEQTHQVTEIRETASQEQESAKQSYTAEEEKTSKKETTRKSAKAYIWAAVGLALAGAVAFWFLRRRR